MSRDFEPDPGNSTPPRAGSDDQTPIGGRWRLLGVVLAGGRSSRMGREKALLRHPSGPSFLQYAIGLLRPLCAEVVISAAAGWSDDGLPADQREGIAVLEDPVAGLGPAIGVAAAVQAAARRSFDAVLVIPVDMPALATAHLTTLIAAHRRAPDQLVAATFAADGCCEPLLAVYPVRFASALQQLADSQHRSLSRWLRGQTVQQVVLPADAAANLNTPGQVADFERHHLSQ